ncbi:MAG: glycosyltransferase family 4 protein [Acidobacteria bacterium]|nr:glycosyltransferase family 4 protein [Acidobacteriota bacterium]
MSKANGPTAKPVPPAKPAPAGAAAVRPLHVVQLNAAYTAAVRSPEQLLERYDTLTGWAGAVRDAGARVTVVQRFSCDARVEHEAVSYLFAEDGGAPLPGATWTAASLVTVVRALAPDVVHVNGLMFPGLVVALRRALPTRVAIVAQDHAGYDPPRSRSIWEFGRRHVWRAGFAALDACSFTAEEQAAPWIESGYLDRSRVIVVLESSTTLRGGPRAQARASIGMHAAPAIVWVGRLDTNKDPETALKGLAVAFERVCTGRLWMLYQASPLEADVRRFLARSPRLADRVTLVGLVPHARVASYLSAADLYLSGSHREGSGYALIEAMACGVVPVVTDIPSFRAITGGCGSLWAAGDHLACAEALVRASASDLEAGRARVKQRFDAALTWRAIGKRTLSAYTELAARRAAGAVL